jgi:rhodanese-related sulfurtransferase
MERKAIMKTSKRLLLFSLMLLAVFAFGTGEMAFAQDALPAATEEVPFDIQPVLVDYLQNLPEGFYGIKPEAALKELVSDTKPFLIDVRDKENIADGGYIAGAVLIPIRTLTQSLDMLPAQDQPILVYCGIGHRGGMAAEVLSLLGYTNVRSIFGGFAGWKTAGLPVEIGMPASAVASNALPPDYDLALFDAVDEFISTMPDDFYAATPAATLMGMGAEPQPFLIDVRGEQELQDNGYIDGQVNIPLKTLLDDFAKLPVDKDQPIIVYCAIGHRGAMALTTLRLLGYTDVTSIGGGFNNWVKLGLPVVKPAGIPLQSA